MHRTSVKIEVFLLITGKPSMVLTEQQIWRFAIDDDFVIDSYFRNIKSGKWTYVMKRLVLGRSEQKLFPQRNNECHENSVGQTEIKTCS